MRPPAWLRYVLVVVVVLAAITLFLLAPRPQIRPRFARTLPTALALNGAVAIALVLLVAYQLFALAAQAQVARVRLQAHAAARADVRTDRHRPGRADLWRFRSSSSGTASSRGSKCGSTRRWTRGLKLARSTLDTALKDLTAKGESVAAALSLRPPSEHLAVLNAVREQAGVQEASLYTERGRLLAYSGTERAGISPDPPSAAAMRELRQHKTYATIERFPSAGCICG